MKFILFSQLVAVDMFKTEQGIWSDSSAIIDEHKMFDNAEIKKELTRLSDDFLKCKPMFEK